MATSLRQALVREGEGGGAEGRKGGSKEKGEEISKKVSFCPGVKLVSLAYGFVSCPLLALLISQLGCLLSSLLTLVALLLRSRREQQEKEEEDTMPLDLLMSHQGPSSSLLLSLLLCYTLAGKTTSP